VSKETYCSVKRDLLQCQKRPTTESKETFYSVKRDLLQCKTLTYLTTLSSASVLRVSTPEHDSAASSGCNSCNRRCAPDIHSQKSMSKETYYSVKRDLLQCQKRPTTVSKETYYSVKRDLLQCQKRPTTESKETYYRVYSVNRRCAPDTRSQKSVP